MDKLELTVTASADRPLRSGSLDELEWMRDHLRTIEAAGTAGAGVSGNWLATKAGTP